VDVGTPMLMNVVAKLKSDAWSDSCQSLKALHNSINIARPGPAASCGVPRNGITNY